MGALVELFCAVFELVSKSAEKITKGKFGCLALLVALVATSLLCWGLVVFIVWLTA
ncbi:MAG: hypothetical protein L0215_01605 [Gemmataceae bacterium]|nr:hypothetical protein [Gemmataceae bacterium]